MPPGSQIEQSLDVPRRPYLLRCLCYLGFGGTPADLRPFRQLPSTELVLLGGVVGPFVVWLLHNAFPKQSWVSLINLLVLLGATAYMQQATALNYNSWILVGTIFNFFVFRYQKDWWQRYNYILSAALDARVAFMAVLIYFTVGTEERRVTWWGTNDPEHCDLASCPTARNITVEGCPTF